MAENTIDHRLLARQILTVTTLREREGQFLGGLCYRDEPLSEKQMRWLMVLADKHGFAPLDGETDNV
jgi:hypothetical protein